MAWTADQISAIEAKWASGKVPASEIAKDAGCSRSAILGLLHRKGIKGPRSGKHFGGRELGSVYSPIGRAAKKLGIPHHEARLRILNALNDELISIILGLEDAPC